MSYRKGMRELLLQDHSILSDAETVALLEFRPGLGHHRSLNQDSLLQLDLGSIGIVNRNV